MKSPVTKAATKMAVSQTKNSCLRSTRSKDVDLARGRSGCQMAFGLLPCAPMVAPNRVTFTVAEGDVDRRLDQVLAARVEGLSRRQARLLLGLRGGVVRGRRGGG